MTVIKGMIAPRESITGITEGVKGNKQGLSFNTVANLLPGMYS